MGLIDFIYVDGAPVAKSAIRSDDKSGHRRTFGDVASVQSGSLSGQVGGIYVVELHRSFDLDTTDTITSDNGTTCLVDADGNRFKNTADITTIASRADAESTIFPIVQMYFRTAGYYAPGDLGGALYARVASEPAHEGKIFTSGSWWVIAESTISVLMLGAYGDDDHDDTQAIQDACDIGRSVHFPKPPVRYLITDQITLTHVDQLIFGDGSDVSYVHITADFNMSADGVFKFVMPSGPDDPGEPGPNLRDFGVWCDQPDTALRANLNNYPPVVYARSTPRFKLVNLHFISPMVGVDMKGNSGGAVLNYVRMSPLSLGIDIDGSLDTVRIHKLHVFPALFGSNLISLFQAPNLACVPETTSGTNGPIGIISRRMDDLIISDSLLICGQQIALLLGTGGPGGNSWAKGTTFGTFSNVDFDSFNGLVMDQPAVPTINGPGEVSLSTCMFTLMANANTAIALSHGIINGAACRFSQGSTGANPVVVQTGGMLSLSVPYFNTAGADVFSIYSNTAGELIVMGGKFERTTNTGYTLPTIRVGSGVRTTLHGNRPTDKGTGAGTFIQVDVDDWHSVIGNPRIGWTSSFPAAVNGVYQYS